MIHVVYYIVSITINFKKIIHHQTGKLFIIILLSMSIIKLYCTVISVYCKMFEAVSILKLLLQYS